MAGWRIFTFALLHRASSGTGFGAQSNLDQCPVRELAVYGEANFFLFNATLCYNIYEEVLQISILLSSVEYMPQLQYQLHWDEPVKWVFRVALARSHVNTSRY